MSSFNKQTLLFIAFKDKTMIASAINFFNSTHLYGRLWGSKYEVPFLHFELCYYQAINFAIENNIHLYEGTYTFTTGPSYETDAEILEIIDDKQCNKLMAPYQGRLPTEGMGENVPFNLSESSVMVHYPKEFLKKLTKIPRMIDFRDFMELESIEFQNRMFNEINRVIENGIPHKYSRVSRTKKEVSKTILYGKLNINFEKVQSFNENGKIFFLLRKEGGSWNTYSSDMDNQILMNLQAGRYYLKVSGILRKTFTLIPGTDFQINLE